jgi:hypothetical protein
MTPSDMPDTTELRRLVLAEYHEMPGLMLTLPQAMRLFGACLIDCQQTLDQLVAEDLLTTNGRVFMRADGGARAA